MVTVLSIVIIIVIIYYYYVNLDFLHCFYLVFYPRDALRSAVYAVVQHLSVSLSICLSHAGIVSKWLNLS